MAKARCPTAPDFDAGGRETHVDFFHVVSILGKGGYHGYVGIACQGDKLTELQGFRAIKELLEAARSPTRTD